MATKIQKATFSNYIGQPIKFDLNQEARRNGRILVASGTRTRNRDWYTNKMLRFDPAGVRTGAWQRQGGLVLYMHDFNIPLAKSSVYLEDGMLWAPDNLDFHRRVIPVPAEFFASTPGTIDTGVLADLWEQGYLNTVSIHITLDVSDAANIEETEDEIILRSSEMIEYSIVTVPGDRESHRQNYQFMLENGVREDVAGCLSCYLSPRPRQFSFNAMEATKMEDELEVQEEEVFEEDEAVEDDTVEEVEESADTEIEVPMSDVVNALAQSPDFINGIIQAVVGNPQVLRKLARSVAGQMPQQRRLVLKVTSDEQPAPQPAVIAATNGSSDLAFSAPKPPKPKVPGREQSASDSKPNITRLVR